MTQFSDRYILMFYHQYHLSTYP